MRLQTSLRLTSHNLAIDRWHPAFSTRQVAHQARLGELQFRNMRLRTPALFPVFNMLTGPATHGLGQTGGIFKYLKKFVLLGEQYPCYLTEVLHFSDFGISPSMLDRWLPRDGTKNLHTWMADWAAQESRAPIRQAIFCDSGGFRMLFNTELDLEHFGVRPTAESILQLQLRFGANMAASLDYPLPPDTSKEDEKERTKKSRENAVALMALLDDVPDEAAPLPYLAVHGQTDESIRRYVDRLLARLASFGVKRPFGLAIGSLVPRRSSYEVVVDLVRTAMETIRHNPHFDPATIPVHVFGITGDMIPVLAYLGVDTFDSSSHIQSARALGYYEPDSWKPIHFGKLTDLVCDCPACREMRRQGLSFMQEMLDAQGYRLYVNERTGDDFLKSEVYALVAWHNLSLQIDEVDTTRRAIHDDALVEHVVRVGTLRPRSQKLLGYLRAVDSRVEARIEHALPALFPEGAPEAATHSPVLTSLSYRPDDFNVLNTRYSVPKGKRVLLLLPCAHEKPYSASRSHRIVSSFIEAWLGKARITEIEKVSISGLYGPVPQACEDLPEVVGYNYYLNSSAHQQIELVTTRLAEFLQRFGGSFEAIVGYAVSPAYRTSMDRAFQRVGRADFSLTRRRAVARASLVVRRICMSLLTRWRPPLAWRW